MLGKATNKTEKEIEARREFLKKAGSVTVAVPVATLLVAAGSKKLKAGGLVNGFYGGGDNGADI